MEARVTRAPLILLLCWLVLLLRLPFLNQAIQGDDHIYLAEAPTRPDRSAASQQYTVRLPAAIDGRSARPLAPAGNAWPLAGLLAVFGDVREVPFHAAYIVFSSDRRLVHVVSGPPLFPAPLWATLLLHCRPGLRGQRQLAGIGPAVPGLLAGIDCFCCAGRLACGRRRPGAAAMMAYQAVFLTPDPGRLHLALPAPRPSARLDAAPGPAITLAAWQVFCRLTTGAMPAGDARRTTSHLRIRRPSSIKLAAP